MLQQYCAQRFRPSYPLVEVKHGRQRFFEPDPREKRIGTISVGTIVYIQDNVRPFSFPRWPIRCNPWIVRAWRNREYYPAVAGAPRTTYMAGGHLAVVQSLRDGRIQDVADWVLLRCIDAGLVKEAV